MLQRWMRLTRHRPPPLSAELAAGDPALSVYSFARINAVLDMEVRDYFVQGRRGWVRLHEKGGKEHEVPRHHNLEKYLDEYTAVAGIASDPDGPLFRTAVGKAN